MRIAIYSRGLEGGQLDDLKLLLTELALYKIEPVVFQNFFNQFYSSIDISAQKYSTFNCPEDLEDIDCLISLGGDGTLLDAVTFIGPRGIPVLGINYGRLAFALNEFTIHKKDTSPMIKIHTYLNGELLNTYWADGLIVSTPTGSTGYSLSCNGPVVFPESASFVITPVSPHNLNIRPLVVPDNTILSFEVEGRTDGFLCTLDSRREIVTKEVLLAVRKETFCVNLVRLNENNFLQTLRNKLSWGLDKRN
jgi:NAD+ kinase